MLIRNMLNVEKRIWW